MARKKDDGRNKPLYMISVAAELTGMHPQTCILARTLTVSILSQS